MVHERKLGPPEMKSMRRASLRDLLRTADLLAVELRSVLRRTWRDDEFRAARPTAMVCQLESRVLFERLAGSRCRRDFAR